MANPQETYALIVGINKYNLENLKVLTGAANDAIKFANWLLSRGVKKNNIRLFLSSSETNKENAVETELENHPATQENISETIRKWLLRENSGKILYFFWSGHGCIIPSTTGEIRVLFTKDADEAAYKNINLNSLTASLKQAPFEKQVFLVDACADPIMFWDSHNSLAQFKTNSKTFAPANSDDRPNRQFQLFATPLYKEAEEDTKQGSGFFCQALFKELNELPEEDLLPKNMKLFSEKIRNALKADDKPIPVFVSDWDGNIEKSGCEIVWHESEPLISINTKCSTTLSEYTPLKKSEISTLLLGQKCNNNEVLNIYQLQRSYVEAAMHFMDELRDCEINIQEDQEDKDVGFYLNYDRYNIFIESPENIRKHTYGFNSNSPIGITDITLDAKIQITNHKNQQCLLKQIVYESQKLEFRDNNYICDLEVQNFPEDGKILEPNSDFFLTVKIKIRADLDEQDNCDDFYSKPMSAHEEAYVRLRSSPAFFDFYEEGIQGITIGIDLNVGKIHTFDINLLITENNIKEEIDLLNSGHLSNPEVVEEFILNWSRIQQLGESRYSDFCNILKEKRK